MIEALLVKQFRNWEEKLLRFSSSANIIFGPNAEGKTSLLEALHLLSLGTSWRTDKWSDLILWESDAFTLQTRIIRGETRHKITLTSNGKEKRLEIDGALSSKLSGLIGFQPLVLIAPSDPLIRGAPEERRKFLDLTLSQLEPSYLATLSRFKLALSHRNALLKRAQTKELPPFEEEMALLSEEIYKKRAALTETLNKKVALLYPALSGEKIIPEMRLEGEDLPTAEWMLQRFKERLEEELRFGFTLTGPHRSRINIRFKGHDAKQAMSEGQMQNAVAALRLATWELFAETRSEKPILLIDDFGSALDERRQSFLLESLAGFGQTFITTVHDLKNKQLPSGSCFFQRY